MALNLDFVRQDYAMLGPCERGTMKLLAQGKTVCPFVYGDLAGEVGAYEMKKGEPHVSWQLPQSDKGISSVRLSRAKAGKKQNVFIGAGNLVRGATQKGKHFFKMETYNTEAIKHLLIDGQKLHTGSDFLLNAYDVVPNQISDSGLFLCEDKILDATLQSVFGSGEDSSPVLACQDKSIRLLDNMKLYYQIPFESPVLSLARLPQAPGRVPIGYSTKSGSIGVFDLQKDLPKLLWDLGQEGEPGVCALTVGDFSRGEMIDYVLGREDGSVELWSAPTFGSIPEQRLRVELGESLASVEAGCITSATPEILVSAFSGQVVGVADRKTVRGGGGEQERLKKIRTLTADVQRLEQKLADLSELKSDAGVTALESAKYQCTAELRPLGAEGAFEIRVESGVPMEYVTLQSGATVDILDSSESNSALNQQVRSELFRFQAILHCVGFTTQKIKLKLRTSEGHGGHLHVHVLPHGPCKVVRAFALELKPLSLHTRVLEPPIPAGALSEIRVTGSFSQLDFHSWVMAALPEVPPQMEEGEIAFRSSFVGSVLLLRYEKGSASVRSDSLSTLTIFKDVLLQQASRRKVQIDFSTSLEPDSVYSILHLLQPQLDHAHQLNKDFRTLEALQELQMAGEEAQEFLQDPRHQQLLLRAEKVRQEHAQQPRKLNFLFSVISDLYVDRSKVVGRPYEKALGQLKGLFAHYSFEKILAFFQDN